MELKKAFWKNKKVFITGHTGFKGTWLSLWLHHLGADITGYALEPPTQPNLFELIRTDSMMESHIQDIRDLECLEKKMKACKPDIVFHLAAQALVRDSYKIPVETYATNVMGSVNVLNTVRHCPSVRSVVIITSDKCYHDKEWSRGYCENDNLWGYDPYASSKACAEMVTSAYRNSFFNPKKYDHHGVAVASARSGNVIGGGDWGHERLIPDCICALLANKPIKIRNPDSIRPWQHVLNTLSGYLILARKLFCHGPVFAEAWNFGPDESDTKSVEWIVKKLCELWPDKAYYQCDKGSHPHETGILRLDSSRARRHLDWQPFFTIDMTLKGIVDWTMAYQKSMNMTEVCLQQILDYERLASA